MATQWQLTGDYFENCNCNVVCPCLASPAAPLTSRPSQGVCDVAPVTVFSTGKVSTKRVTPGPLSAWALPPCNSMMVRTIASPSPVDPLVELLLVREESAR